MTTPDPRDPMIQQAIQPRPAPVGWSTEIVNMSRQTPEGVEAQTMVELTFHHPLGTLVTFWSGDDIQRLARDLKGVGMDANRAKAQSNGLVAPEPSKLIIPGQPE